MILAGLAALLLIGFLIVRGRNVADPAVRPIVASAGAQFEIVAEVGGMGGFAYGVDADGSRAAFGRGHEVVVADVSNPSSPTELHVVPVGGEVRDVKLVGNRVYVAADTAGLRIVHLEEGTVTDSMLFGDRAYGVDVVGEHVYVAARSEGLRIIDVSDLAGPVEIGSLSLPDDVVGLVVRGNYAYVAAWYESLRVVDVSDPTDPVETGFAPFQSYDHGAVWGVAVDGDLAIAAIPEKGLRTVDVSNRDSVKNHGMYYKRLHAPVGVDLHGPFAYVADQDEGLRILDLTDPQQPVEIGSIDLPGRAMAVHVHGGMAYVAAREGGLRLVDVSVPNDPREVGFVDPEEGVIDVVSAAGGVWAVGSENGVYRYDGRKGLATRLGERARRVVVDGHRMVTIGPEGVRILEEGALLGGVSGAAHGAAVLGDALVTAGPWGLRVFEGVGSGSPRLTGRFEVEWAGEGGKRFLRTPPVAWDVLLEDDRAYAAFDDGIYLLDLTDRRAPQLVARVETPQRVYRLVRLGGRLFAACDDGLRVFDVSDAFAIGQIAHVETSSFAMALLLDGETVYAGDLSGWLTAMHASDAQPIGSWRVADRIYALARVEEGIAVAAGSQGLRVVSLQEDPEG